ncbi:MAG: hypothetical protein ABIJ08_03175 [Nanoarchaeota archaeon]
MRYTTLLVILLMLANITYALEADITINDKFGVGDEIKFDYTITSDQNINVTIIPKIICPSLPVAEDIEQRIEVKGGILYKDEYNSASVKEYFQPQTCKAKIIIINPYYFEVEKEFKIETKPSFNLEFNTCKDKSCTIPSNIFLQNENIYFNLNMDVENPVFNARLTYPDGTTEGISRTDSIKADQLGKYSIELLASKEGYQDISQKLEFEVVGTAPNVRSASNCNVNGVCDNTETPKDCPQDCIQKIGDKQIYSSVSIGLIVGLLVLIIIIFVIYLRKKK